MCERTIDTEAATILAISFWPACTYT